ncbi:putative GIY-YIG superfamily endonuclease [Bradyrhizobium sp. USDA 4454]
MGPRSYYVYILASHIGGTLYIGVTNDLIRRVGEHKLKLIKSFTEKYDVVKLVYFEQFDDPENAIKREKRLKKWNRAWKVRLIEEQSKLGRLVSGNCRCLTVRHAPRRRGIQYAGTTVAGRNRHGVLDRPPSRTMTSRWDR